MGAARGAAIGLAVVITLGVGVASQSGGGLIRVHTNSPGLLAGSGMASDPLTMTIHTDGVTMTGNGSAGSQISADPGIGVLNYGMFGDGSDGVCSWDGSTTVVGVAPVGGTTYTLTRDVFCSSATVSSGITVIPQYRIFVLGTLTLDGKIAKNGGPGGSGTTATAGGTGTTAAYFGASGAGGGGNNNVCSSGVASSTAPPGCSNTPGGACKGGRGGGGGAGGGFPCSGGTVTVATGSPAEFSMHFWRNTLEMVSQRNANAGVAFSGGSGGAGSRSALNNGCWTGGGGGGGGIFTILAHTITGSGSLEAKGGDGQDGCTNLAGSSLNGAGGSGGGGGGVIGVAIEAGPFPTIVVTGGAAGIAHSTSGLASNGEAGGPGLVFKFRARLSCPSGGC